MELSKNKSVSRLIPKIKKSPFPQMKWALYFELEEGEETSAKG